MRIFMINAVPYGSPAKIMYGVANCAKRSGMEVLTATGYSNHPAPETPESNIIVSGFLGKSIHMLLSIITGRECFFSILGTLKLIISINKFNPDLIHIHNLHGWYINLPILLRYINKKRIKVIWTLHDCWAVTGHCTHFAMVHCEKWKSECNGCSLYKDYPMSCYDNSRIMHETKKRWFSSIEELNIVTPSKWLSEIVGQSYLKNKKVNIINNGIDLDIYKPVATKFATEYHIENKNIVLGVSIAWSKRKGIDVFSKLAEMLGDQYQIVLVGTDDQIDNYLPSNVITIHRTENQNKLAEIYSAASVFVNPTREDNFPTVNIEALACGTPVITFNTGGSVEMIDETCGIIVEQEDIESLKSSIEKVCTQNLFSRDACVKKATEYCMNDRFLEYIDLYNKVLRVKL